jgi:hypothetical protein
MNAKPLTEGAVEPQEEPAIQTIGARTLPGWMEREQAIFFFTTQCVPALTIEQAGELWESYREKVKRIERAPCPCRSDALSESDTQHVEALIALLESANGKRHEVEEVVKVDLRDVTAIQYLTITERAHDYAGMSSDQFWRDDFLPTRLKPSKVGMKFSIGQPDHSHPLHSTIIYDLPDAEFAFLPHGNGFFSVSELSRQVISARVGQRLILKNGYHRCLAKMLSAQSESAEPMALIAVEKQTLSAGLPYQDEQWLSPGIPYARLSDYLDESLYLDVNMRRKRYQIEVKARWQAVDDV